MNKYSEILNNTFSIAKKDKITLPTPILAFISFLSPETGNISTFLYLFAGTFMLFKFSGFLLMFVIYFLPLFKNKSSYPARKLYILVNNRLIRKYIIMIGERFEKVFNMYKNLDQTNNYKIINEDVKTSILNTFILIISTIFVILICWYWLKMFLNGDLT